MLEIEFTQMDRQTQLLPNYDSTNNIMNVKASEIKLIILFITLTFSTSWFVYFIFGVHYDLVMFIPGVFGCLITFMTKDKVRKLFKLGSIWDIGLGILLPSIVGLIFLLIATSFSLGKFGLPEEAIIYNDGNLAQAWLRLFVFGIPYMLAVNLMFSIGEEVGWRGFLLNKLKKQRSQFWYRSFAVGVIWGCWHLPIYLDANIAIYHIIIFVINVCLISVVYAWLYEKHNSIWPSAVAHATHNMIFNSIFPTITTTIDLNPILWGEEGLLITISYLALVCVIFSRFGRNHS